MKKLYIVLIVFVFLTVFAGCTEGDFIKGNKNMFSDNQEAKIERDENTDNMEDSNEGHSTEENSNVFEGTVTEVVYQEVLPYLDNRIVVKQAGLYGIIDNLGNIVMPITQKCKIQPLPNETVALIDGGKYGVLSLNGDVLVPAIYDAIDIINEDLMLLQQLNVSSRNNSISVNDEDYRGTITRFYSVKHRDYMDLEITDAIERVTVGQSIFTISCLTEGKHRLNIISFDGEVIGVTEIASHTHYTTRANGSGAGVESLVGTIYKTSNNNEYIVTQKHLIDIHGNIIVDFTDDNMHFVFNDNRDFCVSDEIIISEGGSRNYTHYIFNLISHKKEKIEILNNNTKVYDVKANGFYEISTLPEGNSYTCYFGLMNDKYEIIVDPIYDSIEDCVNGYFPVELNEYWGYADEFGNVLPPQFEDDKIQRYNKFAYNYVSDYNGALIHPKTGEALPYREVDHIDLKYSDYWMCLAILTDDETDEEYYSFVTWDGPIVSHKFPNKKISVSNDGKVAVYNKGAVFTIVELP